MRIGVFGSTNANINDVSEKAKNIGKILSAKKIDVVTGGVPGYPNDVAISTIKNGGNSIAYATGKTIEDHNKFHNIDLSDYTKIIFQKEYVGSGLSNIDNYKRSLDMALYVDAAIIIGGRVGTMYELTMLSGMGKDIYVLENSGGITEYTIKYFIKEGHKEGSKIQYFKDPRELKNILNT